MPGISRLQEASSRFSDDDSNIGNNSQVGFARAKATSSRIAPSLRLRSQVQWQWIGLQFVIEFDPLGTEVTNRPGTPKRSPTEEAGVVDPEKEFFRFHSRLLSSPNVHPFTNALPFTGYPAIATCATCVVQERAPPAPRTRTRSTAVVFCPASSWWSPLLQKSTENPRAFAVFVGVGIDNWTGKKPGLG